MTPADWVQVRKKMESLAETQGLWVHGQEDSIGWVASRLGNNKQKGLLVADEVGMGKTRVVMAAMLSVLRQGGAVAVVVPPGLIFQWTKEWDDFMVSLRKVRPGEGEGQKYSPRMLRSYFSLFDAVGDGEAIFPLASVEGRWLLLSHAFGVPILRNDADERRYWLPILAKAIWLRRARRHQGNKFWQFLKKHGWRHECLDEACDGCPGKRQGSCRRLPVKRAAEYLAAKEWRLCRNLEDIREPDDAKEFFDRQGPHMIGTLLGDVDLLVIDEAHKGRDENSRLEKLIEETLLAENAKRVALTATPIEFAADQWTTIFARIGETCPQEAIHAFGTALREAAKHPDNGSKIDQLADASKRFTAALKPYVTRRSRMRQRAMKDLVGDKACANEAHPHRKWSEVAIDLGRLNSNWRDAVFSMEALGKAAKGCKVDEDVGADFAGLLARVRLLDSRYSAGQLGDLGELDELAQGIDESLAGPKAAESCDDRSKAKLLRVRYWLSQVARAEVDLASHPRVQQAADEIERTAWSDDGSVKEKVLVFGTFLKPLNALRDVLNRRAVLRLLGRRSGRRVPPLPGARSCRRKENLRELWREYERIRGRWAGLPSYKSQEQLGRALARAEKAFERMKEFLSGDRLVDRLPGDHAIDSGGLTKKVASLLRTRMINDHLSGALDLQGRASGDLARRAQDLWSGYLMSLSDTERTAVDHDQRAVTEWERESGSKEEEERQDRLERIDRFADNIDPRDIELLLDTEEKELSRRTSPFCRLLSGGQSMEARRVLQAQFNEECSFPIVLLAQSQVGREGLNLHKACRTVLQFHPEWNAGVVEQQIGRVDRIESYWERKAKEQRGNASGPLVDAARMFTGPFIDVKPVLFKGTYDEFQYRVSKHRRETLKAHLFGHLLDGVKPDLICDGGREKLQSAAPDFSPEPFATGRAGD